jgi:hypothetical protein
MSTAKISPPAANMLRQETKATVTEAVPINEQMTSGIREIPATGIPKMAINRPRESVSV